MIDIFKSATTIPICNKRREKDEKFFAHKILFTVIFPILLVAGVFPVIYENFDTKTNTTLTNGQNETRKEPNIN